MTDRLIYAALVAVWMAYLVPMGIRRYREVAARGSIASFSSSMVALAGSPVRVSPVGTPPGATVPARVASGASAVAPSGATAAAAGVLDRPSARRAAARRRLVLIGLVGLVALTGLLVVLTTLLWPAILLPIALVVAFLVVSRVQVAGQEQAAWTRAGAARAAEAAAPPPPVYSRVDVGGDAADDDETVVIHGDAAIDLAARLARPAGATAYSAPSEVVAPVLARGAHAATPADRQPAAHGAHPAVALHAASSVAHPADSPAKHSTPASGGAHPAPASSAPATWDLRPVTLPTYITKSRASRSVRGVDRTGSSTWSSGRMPAEQQVRGGGADQPAQQRRVVGG